jgi:hypothetical protein
MPAIRYLMTRIAKLFLAATAFIHLNVLVIGLSEQ